MATFDPIVERVQCSAKSHSTQQQCKKLAIPGGTVCRHHGGAAPQVKRAALERIRDARDASLRLFNEYVEQKLVDPRTALDATTRLSELSEVLDGRSSGRVDINITDTGIDADLDRLVADLASRKEAGTQT